jgi:hypothetical protein
VRTNMNDRPLEEQKMKSIRFVVIEGMESEETK